MAYEPYNKPQLLKHKIYIYIFWLAAAAAAVAAVKINILQLVLKHRVLNYVLSA